MVLVWNPGACPLKEGESRTKTQQIGHNVFTLTNNLKTSLQPAWINKLSAKVTWGIPRTSLNIGFLGKTWLDRDATRNQS